MSDFVLILISAILINNFVLVQFLGLCPFMGVSNKLESAMGMSMATTFVLTLASICSYVVHKYILIPLNLEFLKTISFILVIAVVVQFTEMVVRKTSPLLHKILGVFLPLITTNCAVLGVALLNTNRMDSSLLDSARLRLWCCCGFFSCAGFIFRDARAYCCSRCPYAFSGGSHRYDQCWLDVTSVYGFHWAN